jgi:hypothetical protein
MFNLITSYYESTNNKRQNELKQCLINNVNNQYIQKIYLLNDKNYNLEFITDKTKIEQIIVDNDSKNRLKFSYAVNFINNNLIGEICILSNSDIYFDETLKNLIDYDMDNKFLALSRYNNRFLYNNYLSQDSWIFKSPLQIDINQINFPFGTIGCDNIFAYIVHKHNIDVSNPSKTIKSHHLHASKYRTYDSKNRLHGIYLGIKSHELNKQSILKIIKKFEK